MASNKLRGHPDVKRSADGILCRPSALVVAEGWNVRVADTALEEHIESIKVSLKNGGRIPPLQVYVNHDNQIVIVDGHCRNEALQAAIAEGAEIEWVPIVEFEGNDADRVAFMFTSSQGKPLSQYEQAEAFKRLRGFNWTVKAISQRCGKSESTVNKLLSLANADSDIKGMVAAGEVSTEAALKVMRKAKGQAGKVLAKKVAEAKASVRNTVKGSVKKAVPKITAKDVTQGIMPKAAQDAVFVGLQQVMAVLPTEIVTELAGLQGLGEADTEGESIEVPVAFMLRFIPVFNIVDKFMAEQSAKEN